MIGEETNAIGQKYQYTINPSLLTKFLLTMLWIYAGTRLVSLLSDYMQLILLSAEHFSQTDADANDNRQQIIAIINVIILVITGITFMTWVHKANKNCHGFGAPHMEFSPGWSVGYFFIPLFNLYKPYQIMNEIWKVSTNPRNWSLNDGSTLIGWWWALCLISSFINRIAAKMSIRADSVSSLKTATEFHIIGGFLGLISIIVAISLVIAIHRKQERLVNNDNTITETENF